MRAPAEQGLTPLSVPHRHLTNSKIVPLGLVFARAERKGRLKREDLELHLLLPDQGHGERLRVLRLADRREIEEESVIFTPLMSKRCAPTSGTLARFRTIALLGRYDWSCT
jgi:hypothetical protein